MNKTTPYFFFGSALRHESGEIKQYGLYNFVIGRFVLIHHDPLILNTVKKLFSSRYQLILFCLHTAENFSDELIDNQVCYSWSIHSEYSLRSTRFPEFDTDPIECRRLLELDTAVDEQEQIWKDRDYFWMVACYVKFLTKDIGKLGLGNYHTFISEELPFYASTEFNTIDQPNLIVELRQKIYSTFYQNFDREAAESQIKMILENIKEKSHGIINIADLDLSIN
jgi:hypothetical protein